MKAIIIKESRRRALLLTSDGRYVMVKSKKNYRVGKEIEYHERSFKFSAVLSPVFSALILIVLAAGIYTYVTPVAAITMDINPSLELEINRFEFIIGSKGLNAKGEALLENSDHLNRSVKRALHNLIESASDEGYIVEDSDNQILLTVLTSNFHLNEKVTNMLKNTQEDYDDPQRGIGIIVASYNQDRLEEADELGISPGKLLLIHKIEADEDIELDPSELKEWSVKDIVALGKKISENNRKNKEKETNENNASETGQEASSKGKENSSSGKKGN
jgi:hypothetical protein